MFYEKAQQLIENKESKKTILKNLATSFCISEKEVHKRIRSLFGKSLDEVLKPTKSELTMAILKANSIDDLKKDIKMSVGLGSLYEEYYGVSTFASARKVCENYREITEYNPSRDDNLSLLISQKLGDGYIERKNSFHIQHGEKQFEYLVEKVKIFNKAFPTTNPVGSIKKYWHKQGHWFYSWRSGVFNSSQFKYVEETPNNFLVKELTPFGMFLLYMDDGCLAQKNVNVLSICNPCNETRVELMKFLKSYGISSVNYQKDMEVCMTNIIDVTAFLNTFVKPFKKYIPANMEYKMNLVI